MLDLRRKKFIRIFIPIILLLGAFVLSLNFGHAAIRKEFNYQGKLTDASGLAVADGVYDVTFRIYTQAGGGTAVWMEDWKMANLFTDSGTTVVNDGCASGVDKISYTSDINETSLAPGQTLWDINKKQSTVIESIDTTLNYICAYDPASIWAGGDQVTNRIYVKNGLFSIMVGSVTPQTTEYTGSDYYLGVTVGSDAEMVPRKKMGAVPQAWNANSLSGSGIVDIDNTSVLQDAANINYNPLSGNYSAFSLIYGSAGGTGTALSVLQQGAGNIVNISNGSGSVFNILNNGNVGIGTTTPSAKLDIAGGNLDLDSTTYANQFGVITKNGTRFIHDFNYGNNGTVTTNGANIFIGLNAGNLTMGSGATSNYHASYNTIVGNAAFYSNTVGYYNSIVGYNALYFNTTGHSNSAVGLNTLYSNTTGYFNSAVGTSALSFNTTGYSNSALGADAGRYIADGVTANQTSNTSLYLGSSTKALASGDTNEIVIGYNAVGLGSNTVVLGNNSIATTVLRGNVGIGTESPLAKLNIKDSSLASASGQNILALESSYDGAVVGSGGRIVFKYGTDSREAADIRGYTFGTSATGLAFGTGWSAVTTKMVIDNSGKVGIGTTTPTEKLQVTGNIDMTGSDRKIYMGGIGNTVFGLVYNQSYPNHGLFYYREGSPDYVTISPNGGGITNPVAFFSGNGNVGIGTVSPQQSLTLGSGDSFAINMSSPLTPALTASATGGTLAAATYYYKITALDGVGETVGGTEASVTTTSNTSSVAISWTAITGASSYKIYRGTSAGGENTFYASTTNSFTDTGIVSLARTPPTATTAYVNKISSSGNSWLNGGNIGIGTATPSAKLDIAGGNLDLDGTANSNQYGIITKNGTRFIHDFNYGSNGTVATEGGNTFVGIYSGNLTMGVGATQTWEASYNTGIGYYALSSNTTGYKNSALGSSALRYNTTGNSNSAFGIATLNSNTTGYQNSALGYAALTSNVSGYDNSALGFIAGRYIADGSTANQTSNASLYLGSNTKALADADTNEIVIGYNAVGLGSNTVVLGNSSIATTVLRGTVGIGTESPNSSYKLDVNGAIHGTGYYSSDGSAGISTTINVRKADDSGTCTITVKNGLITATDCP